MPKVSVIVIAYNVEQYIAACLESLAKQTLDEIEVLVVNDGSSDGTQSVIDVFVERYPRRFRSFWKPNGGPSDARNHGLDRARGDYVGFVDGDDTVKPDMYEELYNKARRTQADIVVCGYMTVDATTRERTYRRQGWARRYGKSLSEQPLYLRSVAAYVWNKLFRRSLFEETGVRFPSGKLFEDIPVTYSLMAKANRIEKVQRALYNYTRYRTGAITHSYDPRNLEMFESLAMLNDFYEANGLSEEFRTELLFLNFRHAFNRFIELPLYDGLRIKQELVTAAWRHLDAYFPEWREEPELQRIFGRQWRFRYFKNFLMLHLYAATPRLLHVARDAASNARRGFRRFTGRFGAERRRLLRYARCLRRLPVNQSVALFESFHGKDISDSPFYLMRDLAARGTHKVFVSARKREEALRFLARYGIEATPVAPGSKEYLRVLATAGLLVSNVSFPPYFVKRQEQVYLNTWHGTPLKTLGKSMPYGLKDLPNLQRNFLKADHVLFTNEFTREHMMRDYMFEMREGTPLLAGSPRNEALFDAERGSRLREELGLSGMHLYLYMPTWRGANSQQAQGTAFSAQLDDYLSALDEVLAEGEVLLVKLHHLVAAEVDIESYRHVRRAPREYETYDLLNIADVLITDYSSVFFDFSVTGREILLFPCDRDEYLAERDLYLDYDALPFPIFDGVEALAEHISKRRPFHPGPAYRAFAALFAGLDGPGAAAALNDIVLHGAEKPDRGEDREVDLVFLPYLKKRGQRRLEKLLAEGYDRPDAVFVFSIRRYYAQANAYLYRLYKEEGVHINYVVSTGRMLMTARQSLALWLNRRFGMFRACIDELHLLEARRLFGDLRVRSARDASGYRKYAGLAGALEHAAGGAAACSGEAGRESGAAGGARAGSTDVEGTVRDAG